MRFLAFFLVFFVAAMVAYPPPRIKAAASVVFL
jgi:hypothetical protein